MEVSAGKNSATEHPLSHRWTTHYNSVGQVAASETPLGHRTSSVYDVSNRLQSERRSGANSYAQTFTYDSAGNRTLKNVDSARTTYVYDTANQLDYSQAASGRTTYVYDQNGNQRVEQPPAGARTTVTWDYENQPTEYQLPSGSRMTLAYNADNRRVQKETTSGLTQFIWDAALDAYHAELDGTGSLQAVYTNPPVPFGNLISQRRGTTSHWHHPDSLGSTWALTDASESITDTYLVDAWGNPLISTGTTANPFRWVGSVGYYFDPETGLYYIRARVYQPTIARWISVDPLFYMLAKERLVGFGSNGPIAYYDVYHLFSYVKSGPGSFVDPSGLKDHTYPKSSPYCGISFYEEDFWSSDHVWLMDHLSIDWRVSCDGGKANIWSLTKSWDISWRPKWLTWAIGGYAHRVTINDNSENESIDCHYYWCDEKKQGIRVKLKVKVKWVIYEWWGVGGVPKIPIGFPPIPGGSKSTELWTTTLSATCECCPPADTSMPEIPCSSGECEG